MLVRECLRKAPVTVPRQCTLKEAAGLMQEHGVGTLLVLSGDELVGIVTEQGRRSARSRSGPRTR